MTDSQHIDPKAEGYLTTGQFAKLCQVRKQTLFHYDDIGLLRPEYVNEKGYRFYSYSQFSTFSIISSLKEAGLSLNEIKDFIDGDIEVSRIEALKRTRDQIEEKIAYLTQVRSALDFEISQAEEAMELYTDEMQLLRLPKVEMLCSERLTDLDDAELIEAVKRFAQTVEVVCAVLDVHSILEGNFEQYEFMLAYKPAISDAALDSIRSRGTQLIPYTRPAGTYAVAYHKGPSTEASLTYRRLLDFCEQEGLELGDHAYEEYLRNELTTKDESEHLIRICIQVVPSRRKTRKASAPRDPSSATSRPRK